MRKLFFIAVLACAFVACSKDEEETPTTFQIENQSNGALNNVCGAYWNGTSHIDGSKKTSLDVGEITDKFESSHDSIRVSFTFLGVAYAVVPKFAVVKNQNTVFTLKQGTVVYNGDEFLALKSTDGILTIEDIQSK